MEQLTDRVAIVTGAGRGVGRATALALAAAGAHLALVARTEPEIREVAARIASLGRRAVAIPADVADEAQVEAMASRVLAEMGSVDILVNNAGILHRAEVEQTSLADWNRVLSVNLTGAFLCSRAVIGAMKRQKRGHIVNISSGAGKQGYPNLAAYCVSKFGVIALAESLAAELGPWNIKVSTLLPGTVDTTFSAAYPKGQRQGPPPMLLRPEDVAEAVVGLVSQSDRAWTQEMNLWPFKEAPEG